MKSISKILAAILVACCVVTSFPVVSEAKEAVAKLENHNGKNVKYYTFAPKNSGNKIVYRFLHLKDSRAIKPSEYLNPDAMSNNMRPTINNNSMVLSCPGWITSLAEYQQYADHYTKADETGNKWTMIVVSEYGTPVEYSLSNKTKVVKTFDLVDPFTAQDMYKITKKAESIWKKKQPTYIAPYIREYNGSAWYYSLDYKHSSDCVKETEYLPIKKYQYDSKYFYDQIGCYQRAVETLFPGKFREFWEFHIGFDARESDDWMTGNNSSSTYLNDELWDYYYTWAWQRNETDKDKNTGRRMSSFYSLSYGKQNFEDYTLDHYYCDYYDFGPKTEDEEPPKYLDADALYEFYLRFRDFYVHDHIHAYECTHSYELPYKVKMSEFAEKHPEAEDEFMEGIWNITNYEKLFAKYFPEYDMNSGYCKKCSYKNCPYKKK